MNHPIYPIGLILLLGLLLGISYGGHEPRMVTLKNVDLDRFLERRLHEVKMELDRIVIDTNGFLVRRAKRDPQQPLITFDKLIENNIETDGEIYYFHKILVLSNKIINKIDKKLLKNFVVLCGECMGIGDFKQVTFMEVFKKEHTFLVVGLDDGSLKLFSIHSHHHHANTRFSYKPLQKIHSARGHYPVDGKFFLQSGHLFLYVTYQSANGDLSESILFKLRNSYLDKEYNNILTDGSKSVATFNSGMSQIIIIAQAANANRKVSSQVLRFSLSKEKFERIQFLETRQPSSVAHFRAFEGDFVFVCEESSPSTIYWWKGGEFLKWLDIPFLSGNCSLSIEQVDGQTFLLNTVKNETTIYSLGWKRIKEVAQIPRPVNDDQNVIDVFISTGNKTSLNVLGLLQNSFRFSTWEINLLTSNFTGDGEEKLTVEDRLTECLSKAEGNLGAIAKRINDTNELTNNQLIPLDQNLTFDNIQVLGYNSSVRMISGSAERVNHVDEKSDTDTEIDKLMDASNSLMESLLDRTPVIFHSKLTIKEAKLKIASAARVNKRVLNTKEFIWLNGHENKETRTPEQETQHLQGLSAVEIKTDQLQTKNLTGNRVDDFILKDQFWSEKILFLRNLTCKEIFSKMKRINDIQLEKLVVKNHNDTIHGKKYFETVEADQIVQNTGSNISVAVKGFPTNIHTNSLKLEDNIIIDNLNVQMINGINFHKLLNNIAFKDVDNVISSSLTFLNDVRVDVLQGQRISESAESGRRSQTLRLREASTAYARDDAEDDCIVEVDTTPTKAVDHQDSEEIGRRSKSIFQPKYPNYHFDRDIHVKGDIKVNEFICRNCKIVVQNQSFPITQMDEIFWTYDTKQNIAVPTIIKTPTTAHKIIEATYINGKKLDCLLDDSNGRDFKSELIFKNVTVLGDIFDSSYSSHKGFKPTELNNSIVQSSGKQYIKDKKNFSGGISVNYLKAENLQQSSHPELSSRSMRKSIGETGGDDDRPRKFVVDGDLIVREDLDVLFLNGIDIESKIKLAAYNDENYDLQRIEFKNLKMDNLDVDSLNGIRQGIDSPDSHSKIYRAHVSDNIEQVQLLDVAYINDINILDHLPRVVNRTEAPVIRGKKVFKSAFIIKNDLDTEKINNFNVTDIYKNTLSRSRDQNITGKVLITNKASLGSLQSKNLNGIDHSRLIDVSSKESIVLTSDVLFKKLTILGNVTIADSCNISQDNEKLVLKGKRHWQSMNVIGNVDWKEAETPKGKIWTLFNKAVTTDKTHTISGSVIFQKDLNIRRAKHTKNIKGRNLTHIMEDSLMKNKDNQVVKGEKIFLNHFSSNLVTLTADLLANHINQENILEFNRTLVRLHSEDIIEGHKYFENGFNAFSLNTVGGINGVPLDDIVLTDSNRTLPDTIFENLEITRNLDIENYNSMNFEKFLKKRFLITKGAHQVFNGSITFEDEVILKGETFVGTLNNVTIDNIVLTKGNSPTKIIGGCKTFDNLFKINGKINTKLFNNKNLHTLYRCSAFYDEPSVIKGKVVFENDVILDNDLRAGSYLVEGISINLTNAISTYKEFTGSNCMDDL